MKKNALLILSTPSHSLLQAFINNRNTTLDNPIFYQQLNGQLNSVAATPGMPIEDKERIQQAIEDYKTQNVIQKGCQAILTTRHGKEAGALGMIKAAPLNGKGPK